MKVFSFGIPLLAAAAAAFADDPKPMPLLPGAGDCHHPIATSSPEAQKYFDQGLCLIYAFNHEDAVRSFERASELDPKSPMPSWGIALALGPNINLDVDAEHEKRAFEAARRARDLAAAAPEVERAYVAAVSRRYSDDPKADLKKLNADYREAMRGLCRRYPEDLDAATLYAESILDLHPWTYWTQDGKALEGTDEMVAVLESVLRRDPSHLGANHYYIHAVEASPNPERALPSARRLETLAPDSGHLVHMPAHIYIRTGNYAGASTANEDAADVDRSYLRRAGEGTFYGLAYYGHNLHFLSVARGFEGRYADARGAAKLLVDHIGPALDAVPMLEMWLPIPAFVDLRFHRWDEVLALPRPDAKRALATSVWHFARACGYAGKGDVAGAESEARAFEEGRGKLPADAMLSMVNSTASILELASLCAKARISAAKGDAAGAIEQWKKAVAAQDALSYDEPPDWYYPVRESLGAALLSAGRAAEAERVFRDDLAANPRSGRSLFGLWKSLEAQKKGEDAAWVKRQFEEAWKNADAPLKLADM